jgi:hypothetical protein
MATIKLTNKQLRLIQRALDFYSRIGILQFDEILNHPTMDNLLYKQFSPKKEFEVGDQTMRGEIVEIGDDYIKTKGSWGNGEEIKTWTDIENIKFSPNWTELHKKSDEIKNILNLLKYKFSGEHFGDLGNLGIYNSDVDEYCREAYDILQVIRHEFWKEDKDINKISVDASVSLSSSEPIVEVKLDTIKDVRKQKIKKISK